MPIYTLSGVVFFDYNGNGAREGNEPPVAGATIRVDGISATSDAEGRYTLRGFAEGQRKVQLTAEGFRHIALSLEAFQSVNQPVTIAIERDTQRDWGLMQGFLTLCYPYGAPYVVGRSYMEGRYYDHDPRPETYLWWNGESGDESLTGNRANHPSTDFGAAYDTPVVACAPGTVSYVYANADGDLGVEIRHDANWGTNYLHLSRQSVQSGQRVSRGQEIGRSGPGGDVFQHTHLDVFVFADSGLLCFDPYRKLISGDSGNWLILYGSGDRRWVEARTDDVRNSFGYWTADNDPQYPPAK